MTLLPELIAEFAAAHPHYGDPVQASMRCTEASDLFVTLCHQRGVDAEVIEVDTSLVCDGLRHHIARVGDLGVDFTYRQFDESAPFPLVMPLPPAET